MRKQITENTPSIKPTKRIPDKPTISISEEQYKQLTEAHEIHISGYGTTSYEQLTSNWMISTDKCIILYGTQQTVASRHCSYIKATALACLIGLQVYEEFQNKYHLTPQARNITIWTDCPKTHAIIKTRNNFQTAHMKVNFESEIMETIKQTMQRILCNKTEKIRKKAKPNTSNKIVQQQIKEREQQLHNTHARTPQIGRVATLYHVTDEVSHNVIEQMRHASSSQHMRQYLQDKYKWNDQTIESIDWNAHGTALKYLPSNIKRTTIKLIHRWLPVYGHPGQNIPEEAQQCPCCKAQLETQTHYMTCEARKDDWQLALNNIMAAASKGKHDKTALEILRIGLQHGRNETDNEIPERDNPAYRELIREQECIGWNQLYHGRWSRTWADVQDKAKANSGETWVCNIIRIIWTEHHKMWKDRCAMAHEKNEENREQEQRKYQARVKAIYATHDSIDEADRKILQQPIEQIMQLPSKRLKDWTTKAEKYVKDALTRAGKRIKMQTKSITSYFQPIRLEPQGNEANRNEVEPQERQDTFDPP